MATRTLKGEVKVDVGEHWEALNIQELKEMYGDAPVVRLTKESMRELVRGLPIHIDDYILVPPSERVSSSKKKLKKVI